MKITKQQLKQIIREESVRLQKEQLPMTTRKAAASPTPPQPDPNDPFAMGTRKVPSAQPPASGGSDETKKALSAVAAELTKIVQTIQTSLKESEVKELHFNDLIIEKGDFKYGITAAYKHFCEGVRTKTEGPLQVRWIKEENKFLVVDGYHRLIEYILNGQYTYMCEIDYFKGAAEWKLPEKNDRLIFEEIDELKQSQVSEAGQYMGMGAAYKRDDDDKEEISEVEEVDLASLEPEVNKMISNIEADIARLPEESHSVVRHALASRLGTEKPEALEEEG